MGRAGAGEEWGTEPSAVRAHTHRAEGRLREEDARGEGHARDASECLPCRDVPDSERIRRERRDGEDAPPVAAHGDGGHARLGERRWECEARDRLFGADAVEQDGRVGAARGQREEPVAKGRTTGKTTEPPSHSPCSRTAPGEWPHRAAAFTANAAMPAPPLLALYTRLCLPVARDWSWTALPLGNARTSCIEW